MLFEPFTLREVTIPNRVWLSPMCMYSATDGVPDDFHFAHYAARALGGAGLVMTEATGVSPEGRISPSDLGLWNADQQRGHARIAEFVSSRGAVPAVQIGHAGRKASTAELWRGGHVLTPGDGGWPVLSPANLDREGIDRIVRAFADAARRAADAGYQVLEIHGAHGYLIHEFLSPLVNGRTDEFGGSFENRARFGLSVVEAVRAAWPAGQPLFYRTSATDWIDGGWSIEDTVRLAPLLRERGVDLIDVSSGGIAQASIPVGPGYQVPLAARIREAGGGPVASVGLITEPKQAEDILATGQADAVFLGRELLRDPHWPLRAARELGVPVSWPRQYERAA
ncbi:NADH:flavin oxidoreductase/NADH oxidase [Longispora albida]|uniref:NADH:flavin oxidoreductase/NADH oxidase n=1 Tax=Longispora albida TaxID=203523 RepID=UPI000363C8C0|nr:NADH:flavin oxidoreductase/NADH oxidase [Longispora albida]